MSQQSLVGVALAHSHRRLDETIETARMAEEFGADLITLADHPHIPNELETWTMLTTLAAHTERIMLASNVINLQLRPAPVLAKAAATLQRVSSGRVVLGLGSGDSTGSAIFGGPGLPAGASVRPSAGFLDPEQVPRMQQQIDDAAMAVGRDPARIRRVLNVGGQITADGRGEEE